VLTIIAIAIKVSKYTLNDVQIKRMKKSYNLSFELERNLAQQGFDFVIGIDEAGRGPLAGPVVAAAAALKSETRNPKSETPSSRAGLATGQANSKSQDQKIFLKNWDLIRDSKKLSAKQREKVFDFIHEHFYVGVGICDHKTIDRINILQATYLAMKKAIADLKSRMYKVLSSKYKNKKYIIPDTKYIILVDGNKKIPNLSLEQKAIVGGDKIVKSISAASIIAKVTRDRIMLEMHAKYPEYNFAKHKGYGTKLHMEKLKKHGPCPIHRKSFHSVKILPKTAFNAKLKIL